MQTALSRPVQRVVTNVNLRHSMYAVQTQHVVIRKKATLAHVILDTNKQHGMQLNNHVLTLTNVPATTSVV